MKVIIEKLDHTGNGIGYINGKVVFVPKTIPGDEIDIEIIKDKKSYSEGRLVSFIKKSGNHIDNICPYYEECGGCHLQGMKYEETTKYKKDRLINILNRCNISKDVEFIKNEYTTYYRNKIEFKVACGKLGYYKPKSHDVVEIKSCAIAKKCINNFISELNKMNIKNGDITIRSNFNDELLISIKTNDDIKILDDYSKYKVAGIVLNNETVYGDNKFLERVNDLFFEVSYDSFFQVNSYINSKLFEIIEEYSKGDTILDLYSGVGTLSLMASKTAKKVYAIECIPNAVINAMKNAKINNINNVNFILGNVEDKIGLIEDSIDTVIVDPPRSGLDDFSISKIKEINPNRIIYISCETQKLTEDLNKLLDTYEVNKLYALDMFSYTYHCETVVILERR